MAMEGSPVTFTGRSLSDAVDGSNVGQGAMRLLTNLVPNPTTRGTWVCRPGAVDKADFTAWASFDNPGAITGLLVIGDIAYGFVTTDDPSNKDRPFAIDLTVDGSISLPFLPVSGIESGNTPDTQPTVGQWTPPILAKVGTRIVATHPGFSGGDIKFGWFDISGFVLPVTVDFISGAPFLFGGFSLVGIQPGMTVTGNAAIPAGARVKNVFPNTQSVNEFVADSHSTDIIDGIALGDFAEMYPGKLVSGPGIEGLATVIETPTGASIRIDRPTTTTEVNATFRIQGNITNVTGFLNRGDFASGTNTILNAIVTDVHTGQLLTGAQIPAAPPTYVVSVSGTTITMSQDATGTATNEDFAASGVVVEMTADATGTSAAGGAALTISGGTPGAPLWGAGDTAINALPSVPLSVAEMNGRAWFACGEDGIPWSDSLQSGIRSSATQALLPGNGLPVTALGQLMLSTMITGGIVISLIAFQQASAMQQIQGDAATSNLSINPLPVQTGTFAPNSIAPSSLGLFFMSPEGLRLIDFQAKVSDPIGQDGDGIVGVFLQVANPPETSAAPASRIAACAGGRTLRIDVPLTDGTWANYWFDLTRKIWTGPHTGSATLCKVWRDWMLIAPYGRNALLQQAADEQHPNAVFVENGEDLEYAWEPTLMPDTGQMAENAIIESAIMVALQPAEQTQIDFLNEVGAPIDGVTLRGLVIPEAVWGRSIWGVTLAGPDPGYIRQRQLNWTRPIIFKQGTVNIRGLSSATIVLGNFYMRYQVQGYLLEVPQIPAAPAYTGFLLSNGGVQLTGNQGTNLRAR